MLRIYRPTWTQKIMKVSFWAIVILVAGFSGFLDFEDMADPKWKPIPSLVGAGIIVILFGAKWFAKMINWRFVRDCITGRA